MRRWLRLALALSPFGLTAMTFVWLMTTNPFVAPFVARGTDQLAITLEREMTRTVNPEWLVPRFQDAVAAKDLDRIEMHIDLAQAYQIPLPPETLTLAGDIVAAQSGFVANSLSCAQCAVDISSCRSIAQLGACAVPFEVSPAGDLNALRRAGVNYATGAEVDGLDLGLALVGLGATAAIVVSGGTSGTIKLGAGLIRTARRLGSLTPDFARILGGAARLPVNWSRVPAHLGGRAPLDEITDTVQLARLGAIAADLGRLRRNTDTAQALVLMRHIDSAEDAARLARVSDAAGPNTRRIMQVLGKSRVFRAMVRLSDATIGALAFGYALIVQILVFCGQQCGNLCLRRLRRLI